MRENNEGKVPKTNMCVIVEATGRYLVELMGNRYGELGRIALGRSGGSLRSRSLQRARYVAEPMRHHYGEPPFQNQISNL